MTEQRVQFTQREFAGAYRFPLASTLLTATAEGAGQALATVREGSNGLVKRLVVVNQTGGAVTLNVNFVPDGGSAGASNREVAGFSIAANAHTDLTEMIGGLYPAGTTIRAWASTGGALLVSGYVEGQQ